MSPDRKKIQKIFNQIDRLAVKGKEQIFEYHKLIDDLISKGDYNYFELTLFYSYNININDYLNLTDIKNKTWEEILFQTNSSISKKIKKVLDTKGVYQVGFNFFKESNNVNIGKILEIDQLSDDSKYYLLNKQYARLIGLRITYLEVTKFDDYTTNSVIINTENYCTTENCLVNRYKIAVDYLLTPLWIESALESLNSKYAEITSLVPNLYRFWDYYSTDDDDITLAKEIIFKSKMSNEHITRFVNEHLDVLLGYSDNPRMTIHANGNVGIGNAYSSGALTISGTSHATIATSGYISTGTTSGTSFIYTTTP